VIDIFLRQSSDAAPNRLVSKNSNNVTLHETAVLTKSKVNRRSFRNTDECSVCPSEHSAHAHI